MEVGEQHLQGSTSRARINDSVSKEFQVNQGVAQGSPLSPLLFIVFVNSLLKKIRREKTCIHVNSLQVGALMYADDFAGICETENQLAQLIKTVEEWCKEWRLKPNVNKSAIMAIRPSRRKTDKKPKISLLNEHIPVVKNYEYLGVILNHTATWTDQIKHVAQKIKRCTQALHQVYTNKILNTELKVRILSATAYAVLQYGSESWYATNSDLVKLEAARKIIGCPLRTAKAAIFHDLGLPRAETKLQKRKLNWWWKLSQPEVRPELKVQTQAHAYWGTCVPGRQTKDLMGCVTPVIRNLNLGANSDQQVWEKMLHESLREKNKQSVVNWCKAYKSLDMLAPSYAEGQVKPYLRGEMTTGKRIFFQLRAGSIPVRGLTAKFNTDKRDRNSSDCQERKKCP